MENLLDMNLNHVKVHYDSPKPAQLNAYAYAQGRVNPTMQMKGKLNINDDIGLERKADDVCAKALELT